MKALPRRALSIATLLPVLIATMLPMTATATLGDELPESAAPEDDAAVSATATPTDCLARADVTTATFTHTFDAASGAGTITYAGPKPLCAPFVVRATTWEFQNEGAQWPQDLVGFNDVTFTAPGSYPFAPPTRVCGQIDIYAGWHADRAVEGGNGLAVPDVLAGANNPYEPRFLHQYSTGPGPTYDVSPVTCRSDDEDPTEPSEPTEPTPTLRLTGAEECVELTPQFAIHVTGQHLGATTGTVTLDDGADTATTSPVTFGETTVPWPTYDDGTVWGLVEVSVTVGDETRSLAFSYDTIEVACTRVLPTDPIDQPELPEPDSPTGPDATPTEPDATPTEPDATPTDPETPDAPDAPEAAADDEDDEVLGVVLNRSLPRTGTSTLGLLAGGLGALALGGWLLGRRQTA